MSSHIDGGVTDTNLVEKLLFKVYNKDTRLCCMEVGCSSVFIVDFEKVFYSSMDDTIPMDVVLMSLLLTVVFINLITSVDGNN